MHTGTIVLFILILLILWAMIEQKLLVTTKYTINSARLPKAFDKTSFVVLADLHNMNFGKKNSRLVREIEKLEPEFIIIAGDMIDKKIPSYPSNAYALIESLAMKYKIYYAYGNHEQKIELFSDSHLPEELKKLYTNWLEYKDRLKKMNVEFLDNAHTVFQKNQYTIRISGVSIGPQYFQRTSFPEMEKDYLTKLIGEGDKEHYQLLIAHNPVYFNEYAAWGADLTVSGHLHGGLVRIPGVGGVISPQVKLFPKYNSGNHTENGQDMVVSRGLGTHSNMPRLFNIPEIVYIELKSK